VAVEKYGELFLGQWVSFGLCGREPDGGALVGIGAIGITEWDGGHQCIDGGAIGGWDVSGQLADEEFEGADVWASDLGQDQCGFGAYSEPSNSSFY